MYTFYYTAKDLLGKSYNGSLEAPDKDTAILYLQRRNLFVTRIQRSTAINQFLNISFSRVTTGDLILFTNQLGTMLDAGIPFLQVLDTMTRDMRECKFKGVLRTVRNEMEQGNSFSSTLKLFPDVFSAFFYNMTLAGETGGHLPETLMNLARYLEKADALIKKIRAALYYPIAVISFAILIMTGVMIFVIPKFTSFYQGFGERLPAPTRMFLNAIDFVHLYWIQLILLFLLVIALAWNLFRTRWGIYFLDQFKLKVPVIGDLLRKASMARFSRAFAMLYASSVPVVESLEIVSRVMGNKVLEKAVFNASKQVKEGSPITKPLRESETFTNMAISMIEAGEASGTLEEMLTKLSNYYDMEVETMTAGLASLVEPLLIVILGIMIGAMLLILALPILQFPTIIQ